MAFKGLRRQGYCTMTVTTDDSGKEIETLGTGKVLPKVMKLTGSATSDSVSLYGDDTLAEEEVSQGSGSLSVGLCNLTLEDQAALGGHTYSEENGLICNGDDQAPYCRCASIVPGVLNNKPYYRVITYLRVKFAPVNDDYETRGQTTSFKNPSLAGSFFKNADGDWRNVKEFSGDGAEADALAHFLKMLNITTTK